MLNEITIEQFLNLENAIAVDVRSPIEFNEGAILGAVNLPIFSDEERVEIGTIYKTHGQNTAKWKAMEIVSPKVPKLMLEIKNLMDEGFVPVIHCWRGGMRSKAISTFMEYSGLQTQRLIGGYKAYRQYTLQKLNEILPNKHAIVIHGKTGVGKTEILHRLKLKGYPVVDLEALAGHRGSIFGTIGLGEGNNQKTFDALLFSALSEIEDSDYFIIEAESKRIGRVVQPDLLLEKKENGHHLYLESSISIRVEHIINEYVRPYSSQVWFKDRIQNGITMIEKRLKSVLKQAEIHAYFQEENWYSLIRLLLEDYYDPRYDFKRSEYNGSFQLIYAETIEKAVEEIEAYLVTKDFSSIKAINV